MKSRSVLCKVNFFTSKFFDVVMKETKIKPELPENLKHVLNDKENYVHLPKNLEKVKEYMV